MIQQNRIHPKTVSSMRASATLMRAEADKLDLEAERAERTRSEAVQIRREKMQALEAVMRFQGELGLTEADAIEAAAAQIGVPGAYVAEWLRSARHVAQAYRKWRRDREILRLAALGYTNKEISPRVAHLCDGGRAPSTRTISRVTQAQFRRAHDLPTAAQPPKEWHHEQRPSTKA